MNSDIKSSESPVQTFNIIWHYNPAWETGYYLTNMRWRITSGNAEVQYPVKQEMKLPQSWKETYLIILNKLNIFLFSVSHCFCHFILVTTLSLFLAFTPSPLPPLIPRNTHFYTTLGDSHTINNSPRKVIKGTPPSLYIFGHFLTALINQVLYATIADIWLAGGLASLKLF